MRMLTAVVSVSILTGASIIALAQTAQAPSPAQPAAAAIDAKQVSQLDLGAEIEGMKGKRLLMRTVTFPPGSRSPEHNHKGSPRPGLRVAGDLHRTSQRRCEGIWPGHELDRGSRHHPLGGEPRLGSGSAALRGHRRAALAQGWLAADKANPPEERSATGDCRTAPDEIFRVLWTGQLPLACQYIHRHSSATRIKSGRNLNRAVVDCGPDPQAGQQHRCFQRLVQQRITAGLCFADAIGEVSPVMMMAGAGSHQQRLDRTDGFDAGDVLAQAVVGKDHQRIDRLAFQARARLRNAGCGDHVVAMRAEQVINGLARVGIVIHHDDGAALLNAEACGAGSRRAARVPLRAAR